MDILHNLGLGFVEVMHFTPLLMILIGVVVGILVGVLPGLSPSIGVALMLPVTFGMDPVSALVLLTSVYLSSNYGGSITAIAINTPGTPGAVATTFDGYELTKQGKPLYALKTSLTASTVGGLVGTIILILFSIPLAKLAAQLAVGEKLTDFDLDSRSKNGLIAVKKPVFPFNKFPQQNVFLSPEMKSTGEVIGFDKHLGSAYAKAEAGAGQTLPNEGTIFISVNNMDKIRAIPLARDFQELGFDIIATKGTADLLSENGISWCSNWSNPSTFAKICPSSISLFGKTVSVASVYRSVAMESMTELP